MTTTLVSDFPDAVTLSHHHTAVGGTAVTILGDTSNSTYVKTSQEAYSQTTNVKLLLTFGSAFSTIPDHSFIRGVRVHVVATADVSTHLATWANSVPYGTSTIVVDRVPPGTPTGGVTVGRRTITIPNGAAPAQYSTDWWWNDPINGTRWTKADVAALIVAVGEKNYGGVVRQGSIVRGGSSELRFARIFAEVVWEPIPSLTIADQSPANGGTVTWSYGTALTDAPAISWEFHDVWLYRDDFLDESGRTPTHPDFFWYRDQRFHWWPDQAANFEYYRQPKTLRFGAGYQLPQLASGIWFGFASTVFKVPGSTGDVLYRDHNTRAIADIRHTLTMVDSVASSGPTIEMRTESPPTIRVHSGLNLLPSFVANVRDLSVGGVSLAGKYIVSDESLGARVSIDGDIVATTYDLATKSVQVQAYGADTYIRTAVNVPFSADRIGGTVAVRIPGGRSQLCRAFLMFSGGIPAQQIVFGPPVTCSTSFKQLFVNAELPEGGPYTSVDVGVWCDESIDNELFQADRFGVFSGTTDRWARGAGTDASTVLDVGDHTFEVRYRVVGDTDWITVGEFPAQTFTVAAMWIDTHGGFIPRGLPVEVQARAFFNYQTVDMKSIWGPVLNVDIPQEFVITDVADGTVFTPDRVEDHDWVPITISSVSEPASTLSGLVLSSPYRGDSGRLGMSLDGRDQELAARAILEPTRRLWLADHLGHVWKIRPTSPPQFQPVRVGGGATGGVGHRVNVSMQWREVD